MTAPTGHAPTAGQYDERRPRGQVALLLLEDHIDGCLTHAIVSGEGEPYVAEFMTVVRRALGRRASRKSAA